MVDRELIGSVSQVASGVWVAELYGDGTLINRLGGPSRAYRRATLLASFHSNPRSPTGTPTFQVEIRIGTREPISCGRFLSGLNPEDVLETLDCEPLPDAMTLVGLDDGKKPCLLQCIAINGEFSVSIVVLEKQSASFVANADMAALLSELSAEGATRHTRFACAERGAYDLFRDYLVGSCSGGEFFMGGAA